MTSADSARLAIARMTGNPPVIPATPAWQVARFTGESIAFQPTVTQSGELDPSGQVKDSILTGGQTSGAVNFEVSKNPFLEDLLAGVFRNEWGTGDAGTPPVAIGADDLIPGLILESFAVEKTFQVADAPLTYTYHRFAPSGVESLSISIDPGQPITGTANMTGGTQTVDDAEIVGSTYDSGGDNPIMTAPLVKTLSIDTGSVAAKCVSAFVMNFNSNLTAVECIGTLGPRELLLGKFAATLTGTMYYSDDTLVEKFLAQDSFPVVVRMEDSEGNAYEFDFPKVKITGGPVNIGGTGQPVVIDMSMQAIYDSTQGYTCKVTRVAMP